MELARMTSSDDPFSSDFRHKPLLPPKPTEPRRADVQRELQRRIGDVAQKIVAAVETMVDRMQAPSPDQPPVAVIRRQTANTLGMWEVCAKGACQRARCCRGNPSHCLRYGLPLMPEAMLALLQLRSPNRRRRAGLARPRRT
jgi:hypothetical protein